MVELIHNFWKVSDVKLCLFNEWLNYGQIVRALEGDVSLEDLKDGMKLGGNGNGNSSAASSYTSSSLSSEQYDTMQYNADMIKFRKAIMESQEFADSGELTSKEMGCH